MKAAASGTTSDRDSLTAAHRNLPLGTHVRVTDPKSSKSVVVHITDRGPWIRSRVIDLSLAAARSLGFTNRGVAQVRAEVLSQTSIAQRKHAGTGPVISGRALLLPLHPRRHCGPLRFKMRRTQPEQI
ncbi:septal ring lytic transglycosylase RlpA family protein [Bradyrhizobium sp. vgs-9]|uniref:septal ring lytic transglycosylase RlpA family protein n=1 Tax=Bradyrhizobium sp. vgs-9 TaxID=208389 RepID=UPI0035D4801C